MFGIGLPEMIVILIVALLVVGPDKLPELARSLAKGVNELRGAMNQIKESLTEETKVISSVKEDLRQTAGQMKSRLLTDDDFGGPRRMPGEDTAVEMEADMEVAAEQPWEREAAVAESESDAAEAQPEAAAVDDEPPAEERVVGRNPAPPADPAA